MQDRQGLSHLFFCCHQKKEANEKSPLHENFPKAFTRRLKSRKLFSRKSPWPAQDLRWLNDTERAAPAPDEGALR
jgi:hypothetical protein